MSKEEVKNKSNGLTVKFYTNDVRTETIDQYREIYDMD